MGLDVSKESALFDTHEFTCPVYIEDTDLGGVVYHANYLKMAERARSTFFLHQGIDIARIMRDDELFFVVSKCDIHFKAPARFGDTLVVHTKIARKSRVKIEFDQVIMGPYNKIVAILKVTVAVVDKTFMIRKLPEQFFKVMV